MMGLSLGHLLILAVVVLLFGARRLPELGAGVGKGIRALKKGLEGQDDIDDESSKKIAKNDKPEPKA